MNPVVLGGGKNAFTDVDRAELELVASRAFKNGVVWLHYSRD
jgi:hypothetical protein